ncbi:bifunctional diguanylate cyclase/phosphodiesterase [Gilvimarinus sp. DA14]|uniref:putative bifunctional diguanylate cyclase/phosphodiesterase n=1 Tax=Gilvimarinus sp. DA14 TaxID=2956798 RepID=UPI0020B6DFCE|nr:GGDEF domain-containing response regulator [Gilvimarinus sp. DA14]UTF58728.1 EAL domain-containing protein [Gilvimarinus sp. DA14]
MGTPLKVLFVEDSEVDAELTTAELERGGFIPASQLVQTYDEMAAALSDESWDVVICDYRMPQFSAEQALQTVKDFGLDLPFIITSGAVSAEDVVSLLKQGAHDFMDKSALARLVPAIEREIRDAQVRRIKNAAERRVQVLSQAVEQSPVAIVITDDQGIIEYVNPCFEQSLGYSSSEAMGQPLGFTFAEQESVAALDKLWQTGCGGQPWRGEFASRTKSGQLVWEFIKVTPLVDSEKNVDPSHYLAVKEDITVRLNYEQQLVRQAHYDDLTGFANRVLLMDRLTLALESAKRSGNKVAVLGIDLDHFKNVNDSLGHSIGDTLLKEAAERLSECVRGGDTLARMGGDEFVVVIPELQDLRDVHEVSKKILRQFNSPFTIFGREYFVTTSLGIALYPDDGTNPHLLLRNADLAMYQAKDQGRNRYCFFTEEINTALLDRLELEANLRYAVVRDQLHVHYQPIVDLQTNRAVGVEALVRWRQRDETLRMPGDFIPLAEEIGVVQEIDSWVLHTALRQVTQVLSDAKELVRVALNISPKQLQVERFSELVTATLAEFDMRPEQLELEITERILMEDTQVTRENLEQLGAMGVRLSIDDFGTGYSSLGYLQKYPFTTLKVDRSFVSNISRSESAKRLIETIVSLAHGLGMEVVAEGVETEPELEFIRSVGCDLAQGYLLGRPAPLMSLQGLIQKAPAEREQD